MSRRRRPCPRLSPTRRTGAPAAVTLAAVAALTGAAATLTAVVPGTVPTAAAQSAGGVDTSTALGFTTAPRPTAPPPADPARPQVLRVQPVEGRKVLADVWSPAMNKAVPTFVLLPPSARPAPLLLLLNGVGGGEDHVGWAYHTDYQDFFADKHVLVASPEGGRFSLYTDWQRPDPVLGVNRWHTFLDSELPAALAERLRGTALYLASAPGNPGPDDAAEFGSATLAIGAPTELAADLGTRHMAAALRAGGVPFTYDRYPSGAHTFGLFSRELRDSWRVVGPALGA
ncbi:alpha/beta hydrolase-fold protein [Dietzia cinnamea]|uniref:alpha/beta hydrolase-fold protein n=1 Tax=Dietzia cinnamea TaxID=321318 RepID=UPI001FD083A1|nr:alpha/beta hydrolase-fold protein [Dietzia cinnamea]